MNIKKFITKNIVNHPKNIVGVAMQQYKISRPAVLKHLNALIRDGKIHAEGRTKDRRYTLAPMDNIQTSLQAPTGPDTTGLQSNLMFNSAVSTNFAREIESELSTFVRKIQQIIEKHTQRHIDMKKSV